MCDVGVDSSATANWIACVTVCYSVKQPVAVVLSLVQMRDWSLTVQPLSDDVVRTSDAERNSFKQVQHAMQQLRLSSRSVRKWSISVAAGVQLCCRPSVPVLYLC